MKQSANKLRAWFFMGEGNEDANTDMRTTVTIRFADGQEC